MRPFMVTVPLGLLLAGAGGVMLAMSKPPAADVPVPGPTRHLVTPEMELTVASLSSSVSPLHDAKAQDGKEVDLVGALKKGPVFVFFIQDGCPCSVDAEPLFHRIYKKWKDRVTFVGVIDKGTDRAQDWVRVFKTPYSIVPDEKKTIIHSFKALNSAFSVLVGQDGKIQKAWPGYSKGYLLEMNAKMAELTHQPVGELDTAYAPVEKTTGCAF